MNTIYKKPENAMKASVCYTIKTVEKDWAFSPGDISAMSFLAEEIKKEGHSLVGIYIADRASPRYENIREIICLDASKGVFDLLYMYLFGLPTAIPAEKISDIFNLPVNGGASIFN